MVTRGQFGLAPLPSEKIEAWRAHADFDASPERRSSPAPRGVYEGSPPPKAPGPGSPRVAAAGWPHPADAGASAPHAGRPAAHSAWWEPAVPESVPPAEEWPPAGQDGLATSDDQMMHQMRQQVGVIPA
jgi:hypothetical protein